MGCMSLVLLDHLGPKNVANCTNHGKNSIETSDRQMETFPLRFPPPFSSAVVQSNMEDIVYRLVVESEEKYRIVLINPALEKATGIPLERVLGKLIDEVVPQPLLSMVLEKYREAIHRGGTLRWDEFADLPAGRTLCAVAVTPFFDRLGRCTDLIGTVQDITSRMLREQKASGTNAELHRSYDLLSKLAQQVPGALFELAMQPDGQLHWNYVSDMVEELFELSPADIQNDCTAVLGRAAPRDRARAQRALRTSADTLLPCHVEFLVNLPKQGLRWREFNANPIRAEDGATVWHGFIHDITERKKIERTIHEFNETLNRRAHYDALTGLPNRVLFRDRLEQAIEHAHAALSGIALLFIDLDHFKQVNDMLGHAVGDALLIQAAQRIQECLPSGETAARLSGDEFIVILTESVELSRVERTAQNIIELLSHPFSIEGESAFVSASVGIALYPGDGVHPETLMRSADQAMYRAKASGRNKFSFFEPAMQEAAMRRSEFALALREAIPHGELELHFQPIIRLANGDVTKAEALLRWRRPGLPLIMPSQFIDIAEETGLIHEIGDWVFTEAVKWSKRWSDMQGRLFQISINKSPMQFRGQLHALNWIDILHSLEMPSHSIAVEITEDLLLDMSSDMFEKLHLLRKGGVEVSIDDFGTGYSSMSYLKRLETDYLKIDRSFIAEMLNDATSLTITETIIVMAHKLGLHVVAEGVETIEQRDWLIGQQCDYAQGFLFSKALPAAEFEQLLAKLPV